MDHRFEQFREEAKKLSLTASEKSTVREFLVAHMQSHPVAEQPVATHQSFWSFLRAIQTVPAALLLILFMSIGTGFAAERSLPGDILYPIKVNITENVRTFVAVSPEAKINWETERAGRRLEEVEVLVRSGRAEKEKVQEAERRLVAASSKVKNRIIQLEESNQQLEAASLSSQYEAELRVHATVIEELSKENKTIREQLNRLAERVDRDATEVRDVRRRTEERIAAIVVEDAQLELSAEMSLEADTLEVEHTDTTTVADNELILDESERAAITKELNENGEKQAHLLLADVENEIKKADKLLSQGKKNLEKQELRNLEERLKDARTTAKQSREAIRDNRFAEAIPLALQAKRAAIAVVGTLQASTKLRMTVPIEIETIKIFNQPSTPVLIPEVNPVPVKDDPKDDRKVDATKEDLNIVIPTRPDLEPVKIIVPEPTSQTPASKSEPEPKPGPEPKPDENLNIDEPEPEPDPGPLILEPQTIIQQPSIQPSPTPILQPAPILKIEEPVFEIQINESAPEESAPEKEEEIQEIIRIDSTNIFTQNTFNTDLKLEK
ncbi:hypothetical protein COV82_01015 [Candidatus Peregrinibacteria bacterium CG11_big_fil_rev_8_21_14_0_20_46_8]|nr:MAG: hypothetical protein COV82_01015 [Candidatus Peregrinibacteria bacterium CG11_big_fil_rev_8_21_14_0_20_46_8]